MKNVKKQAFGKMPDGAGVELYTLTNANGMQAGIITYGGTVVSLTAPDRSGKYADVVLGMDDLAGYRKATRSSARSSAAMAIASATRSSRWTARLTRCPRTTATTRCTAGPRASTSASGQARTGAGADGPRSN